MRAIRNARRAAGNRCACGHRKLIIEDEGVGREMGLWLEQRALWAGASCLLHCSCEVQAT